MNLSPAIASLRRLRIDAFVRTITHQIVGTPAMSMDEWDIQLLAVVCADRGLVPVRVESNPC